MLAQQHNKIILVEDGKPTHLFAAVGSRAEARKFENMEYGDSFEALGYYYNLLYISGTHSFQYG